MYRYDRRVVEVVETLVKGRKLKGVPFVGFTEDGVRWCTSFTSIVPPFVGDLSPFFSFSLPQDYYKIEDLCRYGLRECESRYNQLFRTGRGTKKEELGQTQCKYSDVKSQESIFIVYITLRDIRNEKQNPKNKQTKRRLSDFTRRSLHRSEESRLHKTSFY